MIDRFPVDQIPDGAIHGPHHTLVGIVAALFLCTLLWTDHERLLRVPAMLVLALLVSLFAWLSVWEYYPVTGATLFLAGLVGATLAFVAREGWREYPVWFQAAMALSLLLVWDDAINHVFGVDTPLHRLWSRQIIHYLPVNS